MSGEPKINRIKRSVHSMNKKEIVIDIIDSLTRIPCGEFPMGSDIDEVNFCTEEWGSRLLSENYTKAEFNKWILKEYPEHRVEMASYKMMKYPVTNQQFAAFLDGTDLTIPESINLNKPANHPVWGMELSNVVEYISALNADTGLNFRLPSEPEWEYAAKGTRNRRYPFGDVFDPERCNTYESGIGDTTPVTKYAQYCSQFGICDLAGNVEEWTSGTYYPYPGGELIEDDLVLKLGKNYPIIRGGSFNRGGDLTRSARRHGPFPSDDYKYIGFRLVID